MNAHIARAAPAVLPAASGALRPAQAVACEPLTVADQTHFAALVSRELTQCRRVGKGMSVLLLDARPHTPLGEPLSETAEARLRQAVAARLRARVRGHDVVARIGPRQLGVILINAGRKESELVQARLHKVLGGPYGVEERHLYLCLAIGSASLPDHGHSGSDLVRAADVVLARNLGTPCGD